VCTRVFSLGNNPLTRDHAVNLSRRIFTGPLVKIGMTVLRFQPIQIVQKHLSYQIPFTSNDGKDSSIDLTGAHLTLNVLHPAVVVGSNQHPQSSEIQRTKRHLLSTPASGARRRLRPLPLKSFRFLPKSQAPNRGLAQYRGDIALLTMKLSLAEKISDWMAEEAVTSELLSPKNKEKYRENSAE
jgi:hypothetical protein